MKNDAMLVSRVTRSKEQARHSYNRLSRWYDLLSGSSEQRHVARGLDRLNVQQGDIVLEIGPGTGHSLVTLAQSAGSCGRVYGIDLSEGMLQVARSRVQRAHQVQNVSLTLGDAARLAFESDTFNAIFMSFTLELFDTPEILLVLHECRRVLQSGGRIGVVSLSREGKASRVVELYEWAHRQFPAVADCRPILARAALEGAGYRKIDAIVQSMWGLPVEIVVAHKP